MRVFVSLGLGLVLGLSVASFAAPAMAGTAAKTNNYRVENGVKVYRAKSATLSARQLAYFQQQQRTAVLAAEKQAVVERQTAQAREAEQAYERGFETGFAASQKQTNAGNSKRRYRHNRYNYGRRYVTSYFGPYFFGY